MRKFSAILGIIISIVMCATGIMMALVSPLSAIFPEAIPANFGSSSAATTNLPEGAMQDAQVYSVPVPTETLPPLQVETVSLPAGGSGHYITDEYLFSYSFGADFYTEIYKASYKIFNQLVSMSASLDNISGNVSLLLSTGRTTVQQLNNLAVGIEGLANYSHSQYQLAQASAQQLNHLSENLVTVNSNLGVLYQAETAQLNQLNNLTGGMNQLTLMLGLVFRAIGVLIAALGLMNFCKYLAMLGREKKAEQAPAAKEETAEA